jgi:hypothetical protein
MKSTDIFPGKYLRAADLGTAEPVVTIRTVTMETLGDDTKPVLYFEGKEKGVVLNKTNWNSCVEITGEDDSDDWAGHKVKLFVAKVDFQGKRVPAIRINDPRPRPAEPEIEDDDDDRVPF